MESVACPHCAANGKERLLRTATPHRTPLVWRSDGASFHLYVEMSSVRPAQQGAGFEIVALFRYDLDPVGVLGDSALILIPIGSAGGDEVLSALEQAATKLAEILTKGEPPRRVYALKGTRLEPVAARDQFVCR